MEEQTQQESTEQPVNTQATQEGMSPEQIQEEIKATQEKQLAEAKKQQQEQVESLVDVLKDFVPMFKEYVNKAIRTESTVNIFKGDDDSFRRIAHSIIGVTTEIQELSMATDTVNAKEELGDVLWYVAIAEDTIGFLDQLELSTDNISKVLSGEDKEYTVDILDLVKKSMFYGAEFDAEKCVKPYMSVFVGSVINSLRMGVDLGDLINIKIKKLYVRYPEKFTCELAELRKLDDEREALEASEQDKTVTED